MPEDDDVTDPPLLDTSTTDCTALQPIQSLNVTQHTRQNIAQQTTHVINAQI